MIQPVAGGVGSTSAYWTAGCIWRRYASAAEPATTNPRLDVRAPRQQDSHRMAASPPPADLDRRVATVLFVDLLGASTLSAEIGIERAYAIVTGCLRVLDGIARRHGGVVDRYLRDCMMAVFGFPIAAANAPAAAVTAAVEMLAAATRYAHEVESPLPLTLRIGINTGPMIAGNIGSDQIMSYTVIGDAVNLGSRLESLNKQYGTRIIISDATRSRLKGTFTLRPLGDVVVKGKTMPVAIFEVVDRADRASAFGRPPASPAGITSEAHV
jgi:class 3 adenylate cyclase